MAETLVPPPYGVDFTQDDAALFDYTEPTMAALNGSRAINLHVGGTILIDGAVTMQSTLAVTGQITASAGVGVTSNVTIGGSLDVTAVVTLHNTLSVAQLATFTSGFASTAASSVTGTFTDTGNLIVRNAVPTVAFFVDVTAGAQLVRIGASATPLLKADIQNSKVIVGNDTDPAVSGERLVVLAGPLVVGTNNDQALYFQRPSSSPMTLGTDVSGNPSLIVKDPTGAQIAAFKSVGAGNGLIVGTAGAFLAGENLRVGGSALIEGAVTITGDLIHTGSKWGMFGSTPNTKQTITGAKGGNVALANLLAAFANYGAITDSTTP